MVPKPSRRIIPLMMPIVAVAIMVESDDLQAHELVQVHSAETLTCIWDTEMTGRILKELEELEDRSEGWSLQVTVNLSQEERDPEEPKISCI